MEANAIANIPNLGFRRGITALKFKELYDFWFRNTNYYSRPSNEDALIDLMDGILNAVQNGACDCPPSANGKCNTNDCNLRRNNISCSLICGPSCRNSFFSKPISPRIRVKAYENKGNGLQTLISHAKGSLITEFVGTFRHVDEMTPDRMAYAVRIFESEYYLENLRAGNFSRYINHSCNPNGEVKVQIVDNQIRVGVYARVNVRAMEEVTRDYVDFTFPCYCSRSACRNPASRREVVQKPGPSRLPIALPKAGVAAGRPPLAITAPPAHRVIGTERLSFKPLPRYQCPASTSTPISGNRRRGMFGSNEVPSPIPSVGTIVRTTLNEMREGGLLPSNLTSGLNTLPAQRPNQTHGVSPIVTPHSFLPGQPRSPRPVTHQTPSRCTCVIGNPGNVICMTPANACPVHAASFNPMNPNNRSNAGGVIQRQTQPSTSRDKPIVPVSPASTRPTQNTGRVGTAEARQLNQFGTTDDESDACNDPTHSHNQIVDDNGDSTEVFDEDDDPNGNDETVRNQTIHQPPPTTISDGNRLGRHGQNNTTMDTTLTGVAGSSQPTPNQGSLGASRNETAGTQTQTAQGTQTPSNKSTNTSNKKDCYQPRVVISANDKACADKKLATTFPGKSKQTAAGTKSVKGTNGKRIPSKEKGPKSRSKRDRTTRDEDPEYLPDESSPSPDKKRPNKKSKNAGTIIQQIEDDLEELRDSLSADDRPDDETEEEDGPAPNYPMDDDQVAGPSRPIRSTRNAKPKYVMSTDDEGCRKKGNKKKNQDPSVKLNKTFPPNAKPKTGKPKEAPTSFQEAGLVPRRRASWQQLAGSFAPEANRPRVPLPREPGQRGPSRIYPPGHIFRCNGLDGCFYENKDGGQYNRHYARKHSHRRPFVCPFNPKTCKGDFPDDAGLVKHLRQVHRLKNPFLCRHNPCKKLLTTRERREEHERECEHNPDNRDPTDDDDEQVQEEQDMRRDNGSRRNGESPAAVPARSQYFCKNSGCTAFFPSDQLRLVHQRTDCEFQLHARGPLEDDDPPNLENNEQDEPENDCEDGDQTQDS